jgi:hypothetical protein
MGRVRPQRVDVGLLPHGNGLDDAAQYSLGSRMVVTERSASVIT